MWHQQCHLHLSHLRGVGRARARAGNCPPKHPHWKRTQSTHNLTFLQARKALQCLTQGVCATVCLPILVWTCGGAELLQAKAAPGAGPPGEVQRCVLGCYGTNTASWAAAMQDWEGCHWTGEVVTENPCISSFLAELSTRTTRSQQENSGMSTRQRNSQGDLCDGLGVFFSLVLISLSAPSSCS